MNSSGWEHAKRKKKKRLKLQLFPLSPGSKKPLLKGWDLLATEDAEVIARWRYDYPSCGWACSCEASGLLVLDIDPPAGEVSLMELELEYGMLPVTASVLTPSGGRHLYFRGSVGSSAGKVGKGLDIKSCGGYVACPPTAGYTWTSVVPPVMAPEWLLTLCGEAKYAEDRHEIVDAEMDRAAVDRGLRWLAATAPVSIEGDGGNDNAYRIACRLRGMGLEEEICCEIMMGEWNERCEPPWDAEELRKIIENAYSYASGSRGSFSPLANEEFDEVEEHPGFAAGLLGRDGEGPLVELNKRHACVLEGNSFLVLTESIDPVFRRPKWARLKTSDFVNLYKNRTVEVGSGRVKRTMDVGSWWLQHPARRNVNGTAINPSLPANTVDKDGFLNTWQGWGVEPRRGDWSRLREDVIRGLICSGSGSGSSDELFKWVMNWLAFTVQKPLEPAGVALVLRGNKGSGKGTLGTAMMRICGIHGFHVSSSEQFSGRFSGHLENKIFLFADEAFWAGDKRMEGRMKSLITEPVIGYERKGIDATAGRNTLHVLMASNEDWVVPTSAQYERRFCVLDVLRDRIGDVAFWGRVYRELNGGGPSAMLYELLERDLGDWHPRNDVPDTEALHDQKLASLTLEENWWIDFINTGVIPEHWFIGEQIGEWENYAIRIDKDYLYGDYLEACSKVRGAYPLSKMSLGKWLIKNATVKAIRLRNEKFKDKRVWQLSSLDILRSEFASFCGE